MKDFNRLVRVLADARKHGQQIENMEGLENLETEEQAIEVMRQVADMLGWERRGWKIAATNSILQQKLRTSQPVCGITFSRHYTTSPATLPRHTLLDPVIECEFFFTMAQALPPRQDDYTTEEVSQAVGSVHIGFEIAECRFPRRKLPSSLYIYADGFASGHYVIGTSVNDWPSRLRCGVPVMLSRNGDALAEGISCDVMGNPINAVAWLANRLNRVGLGLQAGEVISSGSCNILVPGRQGDHFIALFGDIGTVELSLT